MDACQPSTTAPWGRSSHSAGRLSRLMGKSARFLVDLPMKRVLSRAPSGAWPYGPKGNSVACSRPDISPLSLDLGASGVGQAAPPAVLKKPPVEVERRRSCQGRRSYRSRSAACGRAPRSGVVEIDAHAGCVPAVCTRLVGDRSARPGRAAAGHAQPAARAGVVEHDPGARPPFEVMALRFRPDAPIVVFWRKSPLPLVAAGVLADPLTLTVPPPVALNASLAPAVRWTEPLVKFPWRRRCCAPGRRCPCH